MKICWIIQQCVVYSDNIVSYFLIIFGENDILSRFDKVNVYKTASCFCFHKIAGAKTTSDFRSRKVVGTKTTSCFGIHKSVGIKMGSHFRSRKSVGAKSTSCFRLHKIAGAKTGSCFRFCKSVGAESTPRFDLRKSVGAKVFVLLCFSIQKCEKYNSLIKLCNAFLGTNDEFCTTQNT